MHVAVEMSLYPLTGEFVPPILDFIDRLKAQPGLAVVTNSMSTQVSGDYDRVFDALKAEIRPSLAEPHRAVLVLKVLGGGS
ncbi:MAG TPA: YkoF family thiamine/hydroxymethylpyrimidine-binding protein [Steroidobacteraceae bacterium]|jgi:uncharacterized protein YqgV (UPF0045/DUF77 family)|nr:YkoF family thiamine/hydroxymethylpyrimidine-binding protein [Steroidobacteraceae bacterium]